MSKADHHALVVRYLKLKYTVVAVGIEKIQSVEPRRGHVADCVRQLHHWQVFYSCTTLNLKKMEHYVCRKVQVLTPETEEDGGGGGGGKGNASVSQHRHIED